MNARKVAEFVKLYGELRDKMTASRPTKWVDMISGRFLKPPYSSSYYSPTLFQSDPKKWEEWAKNERWVVYETLQVSDFPECIPHLNTMLGQTCFKLNYEREVKNLLSRLKSIEYDDLPAANWTATGRYDTTYIGADVFAVEIEVDTKDTKKKRMFSHNWKTWKNLHEIKSKSCNLFFGSPLAAEIVKEARLALLQKTRDEVRATLKDAAKEAVKHGFKQDEIVELLNEVLVEIVMEG